MPNHRVGTILLVCNDCNPRKRRERRFNSFSDYECPTCGKRMTRWKGLNTAKRDAIAKQQLEEMGAI